MLGFVRLGDSSLTLRMTLTQNFPKSKCHSEAKLKNLKPQNLQNNPAEKTAGQNSFLIFFHPDYTVGFGISPNQSLRLAGFTAGEELHLAPKIFLLYNIFLNL